MPIEVAPHDRLLLHAFITRFQQQAAVSPAWLTEMLTLDHTAPVQRDETIRKTIRDMLRLHGYKPTGRGKPASEYLIKAATEGYLGTINQPVDVCNVVSLHSGIPISVVDYDLLQAPLRVGPGGNEETYIFNASGQTIKVEGLLCLFDAMGPCANAVKDSQRTKTSPETSATLTLIWGARSLEEQTNKTKAWYIELLEQLGALTEDVLLETQ